MAWAMRFSLVACCLASANHSRYSRRQLGAKFWKVWEALGWDLRASVNSGGIGSWGLGALTTLFLAAMGLVYSPLSMKVLACLSHCSNCFLLGRSSREAILPREPMPSC